jgi:tRNA uracil 4-sulfurtransferase
MDYNTIIIRFGEMNTKGKNKKQFIAQLGRKIREATKDFKDKYTMDIQHDHIYLRLLENNVDMTKQLKEVSGLYSFSLALKVDPDLDNVRKIVLEQIKKEKGETFKIYTHRIDKSYPFISDEINRELAGDILKNTNLKVDVHHPDIFFSLEIRRDGAYLFTETIKGLGGYPVGSLGKTLLMLSGGIDSPVAAYLMMKRGIEVVCIHYASPPYTNSGVITKLEDILAKLNLYQEKIVLYVIPFTKIQEKIYEVSPEGYPITIMRRMMYRLAVQLAEKKHIPSISNGESVGQVASQTIDSMHVINEVTNMPVIRPLAIFDKVDIIQISKDIGTYDISIRPYEDCCTIFAPVKPKTAPHLDICKEIEAKFDFAPLLDEAIKNVEVKIIKS